MLLMSITQVMWGLVLSTLVQDGEIALKVLFILKKKEEKTIFWANSPDLERVAPPAKVLKVSSPAGYSLEMKPEARVACQVTMAVLFVALLVTAVAFAVQAFQPRPQPCFRCPFDWIGYRGKCYYFSEAEGNWTSSRDNCSALGASLALLDSVEDLTFMTRYKGSLEHWIGLSREDEEQPWKWVNHSRLSPLFQIRGGGLCALVKDDGLSSSRCGTEKSWVCNKPELQSPRKGNGTRRAQNLCVSS